MKILFMIICYFWKNEREFTKKALKRDLYICTHLGVLRYALKVEKFSKEALNNDECLDLLADICEEKKIDDKLLWSYLVQKKIEFDAKQGDVYAAKYIKLHKKLYGSFIELAKEAREAINGFTEHVIDLMEA